MENRKRNIQMKFYVTEEEKRLIDEKMKQLPIKQYGAYFRKMAIDGYILVVDRSDTKAYIRELQAVSRNINQIAKRANATGTVYRQDIMLRAARPFVLRTAFKVDLIGCVFVTAISRPPPF